MRVRTSLSVVGFAMAFFIFAERLCNGCGSDVTHPLIYLFQAKKIATNLFQGFV
jgi:hypothetical protein